MEEVKEKSVIPDETGCKKEGNLINETDNTSEFDQITVRKEMLNKVLEKMIEKINHIGEK